MKRFLPSSRTRSNVQDTSALRDQFLRDLTVEANGLMAQLSQQFSQNLQSQVLYAQQQAFVSTGQGATPIDVGPGSLSSFSQLAATGLRYLVTKPTTSTSTAETSRSQEAQSQFRVSQAQTMAEAQTALAKGEKNL